MSAAPANILLVGANGQVGRSLRGQLALLGHLRCTTRDGLLDDPLPRLVAHALDLMDDAALRALLDVLRPDVIVNAAAWTAVDLAETEPQAAQRINHHAVATMGQWAAAHDALVLHYSTDYVFSGDATRPWREPDPPAPLGAYGQSKLDGENALIASGAAHMIVRTAWVYAKHGHNFLNTMLRLARERDTLRVVDDQIGTPTSAPLIARRSAALLQHWLAVDVSQRPEWQGVWHLTAAGQCSWYDFARAIMHEGEQAGLLARQPEVQPISTADYPTPAPRPHWSVLDNTRIETALGAPAPSWTEDLHVTVAELARNVMASTP